MIESFLVGILVGLGAAIWKSHPPAKRPLPVQDVWTHRHHPRFNPRTMRIELTAEELEALPFKEVTVEEYLELKTHDDFNPWSCYGDEAEATYTLQDGEVAHDLRYRYRITAP